MVTINVSQMVSAKRHYAMEENLRIYDSRHRYKCRVPDVPYYLGAHKCSDHRSSSRVSNSAATIQETICQGTAARPAMPADI